MSSGPSFKVQLLPRIVHAKIAKPRHVRYLSRDATTRTLEEKAEIHDFSDSNIAQKVRPALQSSHACDGAATANGLKNQRFAGAVPIAPNAAFAFFVAH